MNKFKYSPEVIECSVGMVMEARNDHSSQGAVIESIAGKIGCTAEQERIRALERKVRELRKTNEILRLASAFFRAVGARPSPQIVGTFIDQHRATLGIKKVWRQPKRQQIQVAYCIAERLIRCAGLRGAILYSEQLTEAGFEHSVGSRGDSYDNALAKPINGLYMTELIKKRAPWKTREWVSGFNHYRLMEAIGHIPPAEAEMNYYQQNSDQIIPAGLTQKCLSLSQNDSLALVVKHNEGGYLRAKDR